MADGNRDSLAPVFHAAAGSTRLKSWALALLRVVVTAGILPVGQWAATRYGTAEAAQMQVQVDKLERTVGVPPPGVDDAVKLRDRVGALEQEKLHLRQVQLRRDHDLWGRVVWLSAPERRRDKLAGDYEDECRCRGNPDDALDPYYCKREPADAAAKVLGD